MFTFAGLPAEAEIPIIKIGWIGPLSGNSAVLGIDSAEVMQNLVNQHNNRENKYKLSLLVEDDQYQPAKTLSAYEKLTKSNQVKIIAVLSYSGLFTIAPRAQKDGVILIDPLDCDEAIAKLPENIFCIAKTTESLAHTLAGAALKANELPCGILYFDGDAFPLTLYQETQKFISANNQPACQSYSYDSNTTDFKSLLSKLKSQNIRSLFFYGYDQLGLAMHQARSLGIDAQFYSVGTISSTGFQSAAKGSAENTIISIWTAPRTAEYQKYEQDFIQRNGRNPYFDIATVPSYDIIQLLQNYMSQNTDFNSTGFRDYLYQLKNFPGLSGAITFSADGITRSFNQQSLQIFRNGNFVQIAER